MPCDRQVHLPAADGAEVERCPLAVAGRHAAREVRGAILDRLLARAALPPEIARQPCPLLPKPLSGSQHTRLTWIQVAAVATAIFLGDE